MSGAHGKTAWVIKIAGFIYSYINPLHPELDYVLHFNYIFA